MSTAYFDCFAGAGGDMIVASLLHAGARLDVLADQLAGLGVEGYRLTTETTSRKGIQATRFIVEVDPDAPRPHRHLHHITEMIDAADLPARAAQRAKETFTRLGRAEAQVHGVSLEKVHFHEVGAIDSIVDIVGACLAMEQLDLETISCGPIPLGSGTVECDHGTMPVPAPATAELVRGVPTFGGPNPGELTTPTAAALFTSLSETIGPVGEMEIEKIGYGAGTRQGANVPNVLRVLIGRSSSSGQADSVVQLQANLDDCTGELLGSTIQKLLQGGALDAWALPATMKKNRPGWIVSVLCSPAKVPAAEELLFRETTTMGVRKQHMSRSKLLRRVETVETAFGPVRIKLGLLGSEEVTASPEFEDCRAAAESHHVAVKEVIGAAWKAYKDGQSG
ncbi:MAG: nickel pincer cofactor biosynthesis protein LarC [Phycisphaerae bacterium]